MGEYYRIVLKESLQHHGIKGQEWGVRNGPPYPLDSKSHNRVVKQDSKMDKDKFQLTDNQKKWIKRSAIAVTIVGASVLATKISSPTYIKLVEKGKKSGILELNLQFFAKTPRKPKYAKSLRPIRLSREEYGMVIHNIRSNITEEEKELPFIVRPIRNHIYTVRNNFDDTYDVVKKKKIKEGATKLYERIYENNQ